MDANGNVGANQVQEVTTLDADKIASWPPLKKALWDVVTFEQLNDGRYINAYDLTDKLYFAITANPAQVTDAMVEAAAASLRPDLFTPLDPDDLRSDDFAWTRREDAKATALRKARSALTAAIGAGGQAVAWRISCPDDEIYGRGPDTVRFHPLSPDEIASGYMQQPLYTHPAHSGQAVQDTWFTDRALPVKAMSGDVEDNRVLRLHFRRPVTDDDRKAMCDALNLHQASLAHPQPLPLKDEVELVVEPEGEPVTLAACPIGLFEADSGELCLKTEYGSNEGRIDAYIVSSGEFFWGGTVRPADQREVIVQPVAVRAALSEQKGGG